MDRCARTDGRQSHPQSRGSARLYFFHALEPGMTTFIPTCAASGTRRVTRREIGSTMGTGHGASERAAKTRCGGAERAHLCPDVCVAHFQLHLATKVPAARAAAESAWLSLPHRHQSTSAAWAGGGARRACAARTRSMLPSTSISSALADSRNFLRDIFIPSWIFLTF